MHVGKQRSVCFFSRFLHACVTEGSLPDPCIHMLEPGTCIDDDVQHPVLGPFPHIEVLKQDPGEASSSSANPSISQFSFHPMDV